MFLIRFDNEIKFKEIPFFRGAILKSMGENVDLLYHNHIGEDSFRYSYPLIQYKRIHGKCAILCLNEAVETIGSLFANQNFNLSFGERDVTLKIDSVSPKRNIVQTWDSFFKYHLRNWLPFNSDNYNIYKSLEECTSRISFLENILIGNLLSFAKGVGIEITNKIECKLLAMDNPRLMTVKGVKMMAFDVEFKTNMSLPDYMGLGKHVSLGYGTVVREYNKENNNKE